MPYAKGIVFTFAALRETAESAVFPVGMKLLASSGKDFMPISLMPYIPYELVIRSIEHIMQGYGKLGYAQTCSKMTAVHTDTVNNKLTQLIANLLQLRLI